MKDKKDFVTKNIELSSEFSRYLFENPGIAERIPAEAEIVFLPEFDLELKEHNMQLGKKIKAEGGKVVYVAIKAMRPKTLSRIEDIELQSVA